MVTPEIEPDADELSSSGFPGLKVIRTMSVPLVAETPGASTRPTILAALASLAPIAPITATRAQAAKNAAIRFQVDVKNLFIVVFPPRSVVIIFGR